MGDRVSGIADQGEMGKGEGWGEAPTCHYTPASCLCDGRTKLYVHLYGAAYVLLSATIKH